MDENMERRLDQALADLAEEVQTASPRPSPDLMARVLADAADVTGQVPQPQPVRRATPLRVWSLGWLGGAVAAMAVALMLGIGVGAQLEPADLPLMASDDQGEMVLSDGGFLPEEIL